MNFTGFQPETLDFLIAVRSHNSKTWFEEHREEYERVLLEPMRALVSELSGYMRIVDPLLETRPAVGKTIARIFRDTRFSKDKSLFRDHLWLTFKRPIAEWQDSPAYFFETNPGGYSFGMGFYVASRETMAEFRKRIDRNPAEFLEVVRPLRDSSLQLEGELYKRAPGTAHPEAIARWYQRKNFYLVRNGPPGELLFSHQLVDEIIQQFETSVPFYNYLWEVIAAKPLPVR